ncbi:uncharacterized protein B0P05DRAFT_635796 [Gilbertella persicaria]|uniref:uncharacterized protein n=1 Tax=Gilbertella persicaria TaxID=101096 RepID=UPI00222062B7|nr:uncharacterized protein B0P05DRAFT_635796 [Gilbertella persicaria]KAI8085837.1 hypothetical protein B0P05DRAFT_635796 [Gilbertella persicaria]
MQFEQTHWDSPEYQKVSQESNYSKCHQVGVAVVKEYKSSFVLEPYSSTEQRIQLNALTYCQKCLCLFKQPTTLSCGFTLCSTCLPSTEPYQCLSFSCLRTHEIHDYKPNVLLENILSHYQQGKFENIKQLLDCSICLSPLTEPITTQCGHTFCKDCLIRTMTDLNCRSCPFCRQELTRIGKVNQILSGWLDYIYHNDKPQDPSYLLSSLQHHIPIIQVTKAVTFPTQHCMIHITKDYKSLLEQMTHRPYQKHYAICVFAKSNNELFEYGTMLQINHIEYSADTRHSVVQALGLFRLKLNHFMLDSDDCYTGEVVRLDDIHDTHDLDLSKKRWTSPTVIQPYYRQQEKTVSRPRPCSMRLSTSAPNTVRSSVNENITPGSVNRRIWATPAALFGKPSSPPLTKSPQSQHRQLQTNTKIPNFLSQKTNMTDASLFQQELHPRVVQFLNTTAYDVWLMQYDWYLQQSDRTPLIWWLSHILPLMQEEKIHLLRIQTLRERMLALICFMDDS